MSFCKVRSRRGNVVVLSAFFMVALVGMVAFSVDIGYITLTKAEVQNAADSAALAAAAVLHKTPAEIRAEARTFAESHMAAAKQIELADTDVEFGNWNLDTKVFTPSGDIGNAVRVTVRRPGAPHFFGKIFGRHYFDVEASSIAMANPRDIVFVVDLSGSMNDDSEPCWATTAINQEFGPLGFGSLGEDVVQQLYDDFGFGTFPGTEQYIGQPLAVAQNSTAYHNLTKNAGKLSAGSIPLTYRIINADNPATRKLKCYKWIIDNQIAPLMPCATPAPNLTNYLYWEKYLDWLIYATTTSPPGQTAMHVYYMANPNTDGYEDADPNSVAGHMNKIGYRTYVQFMLDHGRDVKPDGVNYTPLSVRSPNCPMHSESTDGGTFSFPPREQPTHSTRRAIIAAIQVIKERNQDIPDPNLRDWVSIVTFDAPNDGGPKVVKALTGDYDAAMQACTTIQAVADSYYSTGTESGLLLAKQHLQPTSAGGNGRTYANKVRASAHRWIAQPVCQRSGHNHRVYHRACGRQFLSVVIAAQRRIDAGDADAALAEPRVRGWHWPGNRLRLHGSSCAGRRYSG